MVKDQRGLHAMDQYAHQQIEELPPGTYSVRCSRMTAKYKTEREGMRGLWWAGCDLLSKNTEQKGFATKRAASDEILIGIDLTRKRYRIDKTWEPIPVSLAEESMDDEEMATVIELGRAYCMDRFRFDPFKMWVDEQEAMKANNR